LGEIVALRHVSFEHLGSLVPLARKGGHRIHYVDVGVDDLAGIDAAEPDLLVVLGGPIAAYDEKRYPYLAGELELIESRLKSGAPLLGICLGAQLIARVMGARVYAGGHKEIGWGRVQLTDQGQRSCLAALGADGAGVLHWHGDTFDLPAGTQGLAWSERYANQAFATDGVLALQFHIEVVPAEIERWLIGHAYEIAATPGISVEAIREGAAAQGKALESVAGEVFREWFDEVGL
jgi:GMP synthase (glutamine-hydrolysing)